jgi:DNA-binding CsgD family transcriptional regulator
MMDKMTEKINKPTKEEPEQDLNNIAEQPVNNIEPQQEYIEIGDLKLASSVMPMLEEEARKRQLRKPESVREKIPTQNKGRPSEHAGKLFNVNERYESIVRLYKMLPLDQRYKQITKDLGISENLLTTALKYCKFVEEEPEQANKPAEPAEVRPLTEFQSKVKELYEQLGTQAEVARKLGKTQGLISNTCKLIRKKGGIIEKKKQ